MLNTNHKTIAIVCDFDDTLCHDSTTACLAGLGVNTETFWSVEVMSLIHSGWDPVPAYFFKMVELLKDRGICITQQVFRDAARALNFYPGVISFFDEVRKHVSRLAPEWSVEFYMISSGIIDIVANSEIAHEFTDIWAGEFHYDETSCISFPKRIVSFTDKTRYLFQISKGLTGTQSRTEPFEVNKKVSFDEMRIPFEHMIYLGDGYTDIPCFALLKKYGGYPIAVYDAGKAEGLKKAMRFHEDKRVVEYAATDYSVGKELYERIVGCVNAVCSRQ